MKPYSFSFFLSLTGLLCALSSLSADDSIGLLEGEGAIADKYKKNEETKKIEAQAKSDDSAESVLNFKPLSDRIKVPGFMSASPIPRIATIVGPDRNYGMLRLGDRIFLRWTGSPAPKVGNIYEVYTPSILIQNEIDPTDFSVVIRPKPLDKIKTGFRMAGYYYDSNASLRIIKISQGLVEAVIDSMRGPVEISDELMPYLPMIAKIPRIPAGVGSSALVVGGSPPDRVSTTIGSVIYLNRGHRDGIHVGQIFESREVIPLSGISGVAPEESNGTVKIIYVSDSYSTAVIEEQLGVIRIGSVLKGKLDIMEKRSDMMPIAAKTEEVVRLKSTPPSSFGSLSELDYLEKTRSTRKLTDSEMERLKTLGLQKEHSLQTSIPTDSALENPAVNADGSPAMPTIDTFSAAKPDKSKKKKATGKKDSKGKASDEENLNELILQN